MIRKHAKSHCATELREALAVIHLRLTKRFGMPKWGGRSDPLVQMIAAILSQNTSDVNSERAYASLRKAFPRWEMLLKAPARKIARAIRTGGLANQKALYVKNLLRWVKNTYGRLSLDVMHEMTVREAAEAFRPLKGVGIKTIYVTLLFASGKEVFPVDTHIYRIVRRLGLAPWKSSREKVTEMMQGVAPRGQSYALHVNLIRFGREICRAPEPHCRQCPLTDLCAWPRKNMTPT